MRAPSPRKASLEEADARFQLNLLHKLIKLNNTEKLRRKAYCLCGMKERMFKVGRDASQRPKTKRLYSLGGITNHRYLVCTFSC